MLTELQGSFPSFYLMQASKYALMTHLGAAVICFVFVPPPLVFGFDNLHTYIKLRLRLWEGRWGSARDTLRCSVKGIPTTLKKHLIPLPLYHQSRLISMRASLVANDANTASIAKNHGSSFIRTGLVFELPVLPSVVQTQTEPNQTELNDLQRRIDNLGFNSVARTFL